MPTKSENPIEPPPDLVGVIQTNHINQDSVDPGPLLELCQT